MYDIEGVRGSWRFHNLQEDYVRWGVTGGSDQHLLEKVHARWSEISYLDIEWHKRDTIGKSISYQRCKSFVNIWVGLD